jgi:undecaprenyl diphosphate synthase
LNGDLPYPDLLIRTGGEKRLSNFLLWDLAYTELMFLDKMWPDFNKTTLEKCIRDFNKRVRNYGV